MLRTLSLISFSLLLTFLVLSWLTEFSDETIWLPTQYLVPLLFLGTWIPFSFSFINIEIKSIKRTFPVILFGGILIVIGALLLNTRLIFITLDLLISLLTGEESNQIITFFINEMIIGIILPANEEIFKILPILVVLHSSVILFDQKQNNSNLYYEKQSIVASKRQLAFFGIVTASIFTFLELFIYQWTNIEVNREEIFLQLLFRTLFPIHIVSTIFITLGISLFLELRKQKKRVLIAILSSLKYVLVGYGFHSGWNSISIFFNIFYPEMITEFYIILSIIGIFSDFILTIVVLKIFSEKPLICSVCGFQGLNHIHNNDQSNKYEIIENQKNQLNKIFSRISHLSSKAFIRKFTCPFCFNTLILGICTACGSRNFIICPLCNGFISDTTKICPTCRKRITPLINLHFNSFSKVETIILGITSITSIAFLLSPISLLLYFQWDIEIGSIYTPILAFNFLMSVVALINVVIALFFNRTLGMLVLFCFFLELSFFGFTAVSGAIFIVLFRSILYLDLLGIIFVIISTLLTFIIGHYFIHTFYYNYTPVFTEYNDELTQKKHF